ncbi:MAG: hypothetical protein AB7P48_13655, partial [Methylocystis sp.]
MRAIGGDRAGGSYGASASAGILQSGMWLMFARCGATIIRRPRALTMRLESAPKQSIAGCRRNDSAAGAQMRPRTSAVFSSLVLMLLITPHAARAKPNASDAALRDRCEKRVADIFNHAHPQREYTDKDGIHIAFFHARYDPVSHKCFYLEGLKTISASDKQFRLVETLRDVNGDGEAGAFSGLRKQDDGP